MKVERLITVFDNSTDRLLEEINIGSIDLEELKNIFNVPLNDPMMFNVYEIGPDQIRATNRLLNEKIAFDLKKYSYYFECVQL